MSERAIESILIASAMAGVVIAYEAAGHIVSIILTTIFVFYWNARGDS